MRAPRCWCVWRTSRQTRRQLVWTHHFETRVAAVSGEHNPVPCWTAHLLRECALESRSIRFWTNAAYDWLDYYKRSLSCTTTSHTSNSFTGAELCIRRVWQRADARVTAGHAGFGLRFRPALELARALQGVAQLLL